MRVNVYGVMLTFRESESRFLCVCVCLSVFSSVIALSSLILQISMCTYVRHDSINIWGIKGHSFQPKSSQLSQLIIHLYLAMYVPPNTGTTSCSNSLLSQTHSCNECTLLASTLPCVMVSLSPPLSLCCFRAPDK